MWYRSVKRGSFVQSKVKHNWFVWACRLIMKNSHRTEILIWPKIIPTQPSFIPLYSDLNVIKLIEPLNIAIRPILNGTLRLTPRRYAFHKWSYDSIHDARPCTLCLINHSGCHEAQNSLRYIRMPSVCLDNTYTMTPGNKMIPGNWNTARVVFGEVQLPVLSHQVQGSPV